MKKAFGLMSLVIAGIFSFGAMAADMKIGVVDMQKALQTVEAGKTAKAQLEKEFNSKKKELQAEENSIKKLGDEFKKQSLVMNDEARAKKQGEIQERIMKFQEVTTRAQMEIQQKEQELTKPIVTRIRNIISELAKQKGYAIILEKNENTVLFSQDKDELTSEVISIYNKNPKG
ncbi:MAG: hypothetical protein A2070_12590 [Bdellovibrionales bacterium GWC1_52_8]|nr:MAG: hypothetical protein A2Z97_09685 [Bdellovibrionales bacterium GWB1_52_6]OFZ03666.1 MAG: hypothetical protein A2X97_01060 [Bdellovibrionales bacterium GWA1_52_35]OFZ42553.1 MAG: hypothetical protein A2070_12590 [Bdellovibrionales bacterium GWC1_52_8]